MKSVFARVGAWCVERPTPVIALAALLAVLGAVGALSLKPNGEADTLVDKGSETYKETEEYYEKFGDEPIRVLIEGDLEQFVLTEDLQRILFLEACLAGTAPEGTLAEGVQTPEVCGEFAERRPTFALYGPATFLNQVAESAKQQVQGQLQGAQEQARVAARQAYSAAIKEGLSKAEATAAGEAAADQVQQAVLGELGRIGAKYGLGLNIPSIQDPTFVRPVVFDSRFVDGVPKAKFAPFFPSSESVLLTMRLDPTLSEAGRSEVIDLVREAVRQFSADKDLQIRGARFTVSGVPVVTDGLTKEIESEIRVLLIAALVVMALVLALVFGPPLRLLPLGIGIIASAITFGVLALFGGTLTMASIAGLPVLIGLAVDYAIQLQARWNERRAAGSSPTRAAGEAAAAGGPVIAAAGLATAAGFLVLMLSPIPMVRSFGLLLVAGILIAFALALTAGLALLSLTNNRGQDSETPDTPGLRSRIATRLSRQRESQRQAPAWVTRVRKGIRTVGPRSLAASIAIPGKVLAASTVLALAGWLAGTRTDIVSDFRELVPENLPELQEVDRLQDVTGASGEVGVTVTADDPTAPEVVNWMRSYRQRVLELGGFSDDFPSCRDEGTEVCPGISLPDLFGDGEITAERVQGVLALFPAYLSQAVLELDRDSGAIGQTAQIAFGIKVMPFDEQKDLIDSMRDQIDPPGAEVPLPPGVDVQVVGLPVLVADANAALGSNRYILTLVGLIAVGLVLFCVYRSVKRAVIPLIPVILAPGWSALVLEGAGLSLNPMSATLGALVIAIATEFSVLLSARYYEERERGTSIGEALRLTYARTGSAVVASGITAIAGFAVLALAAPVQLIFGGDAIRMLTEFGVVGVIDLVIALAGVLLVLPAVLVWAEGDFAAVRSTIERLRGKPAAQAPS